VLRIEALEQELPSETEDVARRWGEYLDFLNAFYLLLDSAMLKITNSDYLNLHEVTIRDAFRVEYDGDKIIHENIAEESYTSLFQMKRFSSTFSGPIEHNPTITTRPVIPLEVIQHASTQFELIMKHSGSQKDLASFTKSLSEYKVGNYEISLILAWSIMEGSIAYLWEYHLNELNYKRIEKINKERCKTLTGSNFSIHAISNLLELRGILSTSIFNDINKVRKIRNDIIHKGKYIPKMEDIRLAIKTAQNMIERRWDLSFTPSMGYSVRGL